MSNSCSLLDNRYMKQLVVNRLDAQTIRSENINDGPNFMFSLICNNALIENSSNNELILTLNKSNTNITKFSDRPIRISENNYSFDTFSALFYLDKEFNSFKSDPPNGVISDGINQQTFVFTHELHESFENNEIDSTLKLKLVTLNNKDIIIKTGINNYNVFIDKLVVNSVVIITRILPFASWQYGPETDYNKMRIVKKFDDYLIGTVLRGPVGPYQVKFTKVNENEWRGRGWTFDLKAQSN